MKLFPVPRTGLHVELLLRDEHPPPHVHVENEAVPWEARLEFSFVSDAVRLMDVDPIEDAPSARTVDRVKAAIAANVQKCRKEWWNRVGGCCIENRWVRIGTDGHLTLLARREKGAIQIKSASYDPGSLELALTMKDGSVHNMVAGTGEEQWR